MTHPISAAFVAICGLIIAIQVGLRLFRHAQPPIAIPSDAFE